MDAHMQIAPLLIEALLNQNAHGRQCNCLLGQQDHRALFAIDRVRNNKAVALPVQRSAVTGLATALGVEKCSVQDDPRFGGMCDNLSLGFG